MKILSLTFTLLIIWSSFYSQEKLKIEDCYEKFSNVEIGTCISNLNKKKEKEFDKVIVDLTNYLNIELKRSEPILAEIYKTYLKELPILKSSLIQSAKSMSIIKSAENMGGSGIEIFKQEAYYYELVKNIETMHSIFNSVKNLKP